MPGSREESPVQANMLPKYCKVSLGGRKIVKRILYFVVKGLNAKGSRKRAACRRDCKAQESECFLTFEKRERVMSKHSEAEQRDLDLLSPSSRLLQNSEALRAN